MSAGDGRQPGETSLAVPRPVLHPFQAPRGRRGALAAPQAVWRAAIVAVLLLSLLAAGVRAAGEEATLSADQVKETVLPNGLRLLVKEAHVTELAAVQLWVRAGGFREDERTSGSAHMIEHLVFTGSDQRSATSLDAAVEAVGGLMEATTEKDWTRFACTVNGRYAGRVIAALAETLKQPGFTPANLELEKGIVLEELAQIPFNPDAVASRALFAMAFSAHPYRWDVRGTSRFVEAVTLPALRAYYDRHYVPANMVLVVVGDVTATTVERVTRQVFGTWPVPPGVRPAPVPLPPDEIACAQPRRETLATELPFNMVGVAYPAPSVRDVPDTHAMDLILTLLEHPELGRIPRALRRQAAFQATYETRRQPGLLTLVAITGRQDPETIEALMKKEVDFLSERPVAPEELALAKAALRGSYALDNEPYSGQASTLGYYAAIERWQFASEYLSRADAVTAEELQAVARKWLRSERSVSALFRTRRPPEPQPGGNAPGTS